MGLVAAALLWVGGAVRVTAQPPPFRPQPPMPDFSQKRIGLTPQQQHDLQTLFAEADAQRGKLHKRMRDHYQALHALYDGYSVDEGKAKHLRDEIQEAQGRLLALYADNETRMRRIMTREQFDRFRVIMRQEREAHHRSDGGRRPEREHGPGGHPPFL